MAVFALCFAGCGQKSSSRGTAEAWLDKSPSQKSCTVIYLIGTVSVQKAGRWSDAEIGDELLTDCTIKTGDKSACELQVGSLASVKIAANTVVSLKNLVLDSAKARSELKVESGIIGCEVRKLGKGERFEVRTRDAICGVRGTKFMVDAGSSSSTKVAVREGKVALMPQSYDSSRYEAMGDKYGNRELAESMMESIALSSVTVGTGQETEVSSGNMKDADKSVSDANRAFEKQISASNGKGTVLSGDVMKSLVTYSVKSRTDVQSPKKMGSGTSQSIDSVLKIDSSRSRYSDRKQQGIFIKPPEAAQNGKNR